MSDDSVELSLDEIKQKISDKEESSLIICNELLHLCEKALPKAQSFFVTEMDELAKLEKVEKAFDKIYDDLSDANDTLYSNFLCPCLPKTISSYFNSSKEIDYMVNQVNIQKTRGISVIIHHMALLITVNSPYSGHLIMWVFMNVGGFFG